MYIALVDFGVTDPAAAEALLTRDCAQARAMPGNINYRALRDVEDPARMVILHRWTDKAAFAAYMASDLFAGLAPAMRGLMNGAPTSLRMTAEEDVTVAG
ncbi:hypothetical protein GCM10011360_29260 [Primorskyibacter flagellatus]|uniref:ABM domain-containing protein n=1 Tax=Primorskyibacter flagellatus TaxID=1387277 RepID=A0A917EHA1_9RHOB|nr:antibiotic biosynthesis monooxygenase family protein [Primorskyibacter flagellatus]GGE39757.1 hypothetical protein GCM10011360_29260 [Primorskyibacter flagellatus]